MADLFATRQSELDSPAYDAFTLAANGSELDTYTRSIYVGNGGTVEAIMASGGTVEFVNVGDGQILPVRLKALGTNTTASGIVGMV